jgi:hypothetical protein
MLLYCWSRLLLFLEKNNGVAFKCWLEAPDGFRNEMYLVIRTG